MESLLVRKQLPALQTTAVIEIPFLANAFELVSIGLKKYAISIGLAILIIPIVEIVKLFQRMSDRKKDTE